jgi:hypothetical protein
MKWVRVIYKNEHQMSLPTKEDHFFEDHFNILTNFPKLAA